MNKKELRKEYQKKRNDLDEKDIQEQSKAITNKVLELPIWNYSFYHLFMSITSKKEINTGFLLDILKDENKKIVISKSDFKQNTMQHFLLPKTTQLHLSEWGIPEPKDVSELIKVSPEQIEVIFVPLLAYDSQGNRVGYGKGFYDRFLAKCNPSVIKIGLSFFPPEKSLAEIETTDIPLNYCITPKQIYEF